MDPGSGAGMTSEGAQVAACEKLIPLGNSALMLFICPRDGLLADRPSVCRGQGGATVESNVFCSRSVEVAQTP